MGRLSDEQIAKLQALASSAVEVITEARNLDYGQPYDNHLTTARLWSEYLAMKRRVERRDEGDCLAMEVSPALTPEDVCFLNILQKISRTFHGSITNDTLVDIIGYALNIKSIQLRRGP